ncbi:MAG TPA: heterodisulfide reductase-related iron-sulfur binding cluster [Pyrinomonadaceae bacterium]|nr:heterodisulfide reductase-related iron-sulfur binding cluster [Pyrinomonadaceae bacterium]
MADQQTSVLANAFAGEEEKILACVHCGLCLEACPTYVATGDENDGPRGRIYLMRAVKEQRLALESLAFEKHIDRCLGCRACESACPAGVQYGQLLEAARAELVRVQTKPTGINRLLRFGLKHVWSRSWLLGLGFAMARVLRDLGVMKLLINTGAARGVGEQFEFALALLDGSGERGPTGRTTAARMAANRTPDACAPVLLFKGCVTEGLFKRINEATRRVLVVNGSEVRVPPAQVCCGALHAHAGDLEGARALARKNIEAFADSEAPIITNAGGCGAMLASYAHLFDHDEQYAERARQFSARIRDVGQQLQAIGFRNGEHIGFERTTYDASCHLLHGQHAADASQQMLWAIPDLNFTMLNGSDVCCGGAGVYNLLQPELSDQILTEKLENIDKSGAKVLATGNPGCHMQIAAGARLAGVSLRVCHPVELLDESYARAGFYDKS